MVCPAGDGVEERETVMRYAVIKDGICVNIVVSDASFAKEMGFVALADGYGIGDYFFDGHWVKKTPES